jgi:hypothetical protein
MMATPTLDKCDARVREVIRRFVVESQRRCEWYGEPRRRGKRRYHRSWPLSILLSRGNREMEMSAALYNASPSGVAFLGHYPIPRDTIIQVRLFWHDDEAPAVPAIVRHCTPRNSRYLVGCEFAINLPRNP